MLMCIKRGEYQIMETKTDLITMKLDIKFKKQKKRNRINFVKDTRKVKDITIILLFFNLLTILAVASDDTTKIDNRQPWGK